MANAAVTQSPRRPRVSVVAADMVTTPLPSLKVHTGVNVVTPFMFGARFSTSSLFFCVALMSWLVLIAADLLLFC